MMRESELAREELQEKLVQIAEQLKEDTLLKENYQESLIAEIRQLKAEIEELKQKLSAQRQEHIQEMA